MRLEPSSRSRGMDPREVFSELRADLTLITTAAKSAATAENPMEHPNLSVLDCDAVKKATVAAECRASNDMKLSPEAAAQAVAHAYLAALQIVSDAAGLRSPARPAADGAAGL